MLLRRYCLLLLVACLSLSACKKDLLHWQTATRLTTGTENRLNRILFVNDSLGFVVGGSRFYAATVLTTHDGGHTWANTDLPEIGKQLYGLAAAPDGAVYAIGFEGKLACTRDGGASWTIIPQRYDAYKALAVGATGNLVMVGGISFDYGFIRRADAGGNAHSPDDSLNFELNDVILLPGGAGYISGYGAGLKTLDHGATWRRQEIGKDNFKKLFARSATDIWTCGYNGGIFHTTDGGESWQRMRNGNDLTLPRYHLEDILFTDALNGYAVGEHGKVIYTDDGGDHWSEFDAFTTETLHGIARCPDGALIVCGENGTLFRLQKK